MLEAFGLGALAQSSLLLAGVIVCWITVPTRIVGILAGFGAGAMISAIAFDLVPEAQAHIFAFVYNVVGIPVAAGALYATTGLLLNPMIAAAAMALSSLSVVTNANRLRTYRAAALPTEGGPIDHVDVEVHEYEETKEAMATVKDPVCGMEIEPATAAASEEHEGQKYYFCSESCHQRFVTPTATPVATQATTMAIATCVLVTSSS